MPVGAMGGGGGLAPFDKHPADPGALNSSAKNLADQASVTVEVADQTLGAYAPAIENWQGIAAPEMAAAPKPLVNTAADMNLSLAWASVAVQYWAKQVESFNKKVDEILAKLASLGGTYGATGRNGNPPTAADVASAKAAAIAAAQAQWHQAYQTHIVQGGATTVGMLRDGPTEQHLTTARLVGLVPAGGPAAAAGRNLVNQVWPDFGTPLGLAGVGLWGAGRALTATDWGNQFIGYRAGNLRGQARTYVQGYWRTVNGQRQYINPYWRFRPDASGPVRAQWTRWENANSWAGPAAKWAGRVAPPLELGTAAAEQWARDSGRPDLNTGERVGRATAHSVTKGGAAIAGAWAGAKAGAATGAVIASFIPIPIVSTGAGALVGGIIGGIGGGALAAAAADAVNEDAVNAGEKVGDAVHNYYESGGRPYMPYYGTTQ